MKLLQAILRWIPAFGERKDVNEDSGRIRISRQRIAYLVEEHWMKRSSLRSLDFVRERRKSRIHSLGAIKEDVKIDTKQSRCRSRKSMPFIFDETSSCQKN